MLNELMKRVCITDNSIFNSLKQSFGENTVRLDDHSVECVIEFRLLILIGMLIQAFSVDTSVIKFYEEKFYWTFG